jgi:hypothetical protein
VPGAEARLVHRHPPFSVAAAETGSRFFARRFEFRYLSNQPFVFIMGANPKPGKDVLFPDRKSPVGIRDASRPKLTDRLQLNRGMLRIYNE